MENTGESISAGGAIDSVGLGTIGCEPVRDLLKVGHNVRDFDARGRAVEALGAFGATPSKNSTEAVRNVGLVIFMLPGTPQAEEVIYGSRSLLASPPHGGFVIDMNSISRAAARCIHSDLKETCRSARGTLLSLRYGGEQ